MSSLSKGFFIYFLGNAGSKLIGFLLLPLFTYTVTQSEYGLFEMIFSAVMVFVPVAALQMYEGEFRFLLDAHDKEKQTAVLSTSFFLIGISFLVFSAAFWLLAFVFALPFAFPSYFFFLSVFLLFFLQRGARGLGKQKAFAWNGIITAFGTAAGSFCFLLLFGMKTEGIIYAFAAGHFLSVLYLAGATGIFGFIRFAAVDTRLRKEMLRYSLPLLIDAVFWWVMNLSDRLFLGWLSGSGEVGVYAVANKFAAVLVFVNSVFYLIWQERSLQQQTERQAYYTWIFRIFVSLQFCALFALLPAGKILILLLIAPEYHPAWKVLPLLLPGALFSAFSAFHGMRYQIEKKTNGAFITSFAGAVVNFTINIIFIPQYGMYAAAGSTFLAFLVMWLIRLIGSSSFIPLRELPWFRLGMYVIAAAGFSAALYLLDSLFWLSLLFIAAVLLGGMINRKTIKEILKQHLRF